MSGVHIQAARAATINQLRRMFNAARAGNDRGATMTEYALLLVLVLLAAFFTVNVFGDSLVALFDTTANTFRTAPNVAPTP